MRRLLLDLWHRVTRHPERDLEEGNFYLRCRSCEAVYGIRRIYGFTHIFVRLPRRRAKKIMKASLEEL